MNNDNLNAVADLIESHANQFTLSHFLHIKPGLPYTKVQVGRTAATLIDDCDTVGCVCGWTNALFSPNAQAGNEYCAADALGLTEWEAENLFVPSGVSVWDQIMGDHDPFTATAADAVLLLRGLASGAFTFPNAPVGYDDDDDDDDREGSDYEY